MEQKSMSVFAVLSAMGLSAIASAFPDGPPAGFTGGPSSGYITCNACHWGSPGDGGVEVYGVPSRYVPGRMYDLSVRIFDPAMKGGGFQLSVETPDGEGAGSLVLSDPVKTQFAWGNEQFVTHTLEGYQAAVAHWDESDSSATYTLRWLAPEEEIGKLAVYVAGLASNDNGSLTGDAVYTVSVKMTVNLCPADLEGNGVVNGADLAALLAAWGSDGGAADLNDDQRVDGADLALLLANWGDCVSGV